ncbi:MAG TPA: cation:proton antiporter [Thermoanaerobaculia bacterium]|jgi:Kef-type K+ transport system membrane component KefB|nr:cation:proton antiporter [Thermoanaerobaculia bacterium]
MRKSVLFYVAVLLLFGAGIYFILGYGARLQPSIGQVSASAPAVASAQPAVKEGGFLAPLKEPLSLLLLQVIIIVVAARALGTAFSRIGQPAVIGEMVAGILLGPSLLGLVAPGVQAFLFPADSLGALRMLSQIGVILFMFIVGTELDIDHLRRKAHAAVVVSHASIVVPFFLGCALALTVYRSMAPAGTRFSAFALFLGVAMSITAFPVLARIIDERRMRRSHLGSTAIACAAVDDVTAWCLLAVVVALVRANGLGGAVWTILLTLIFIAGMLFVVRPRMARLVGEQPEGQAASVGFLAGIFAFIFASALVTEMIGIHALFGAFLAGVCMPPNHALRQFLRERLETFGSVLLLPLFFAFTGLRTEIGLLNDWPSWLACGGIIAVAIVGKLGGSMTAARFTGMSWGDSFALGALMNTRGLVELIVLNLGYDLNILSPRIFAMLVLMALVTTFMTGPLLHLRHVLGRRREEDLAVARAGNRRPV